MNNKSVSRQRHILIYTLLICFLPIISIYASGIPGINLGELLLLVFLVIGVTKKWSFNDEQPYGLLIISFYIVIITLFSMMIDSSQIINVFVRTVRFLFYIFTIYFLSKKFFDFKIAVKVIRKTSIFATLYVFAQTILYRAFGLILKGFIPFIPLYTSQYESFDYALLYKTMFYRPTSFFLEPAHFAQYIIFGIVICLFHDDFRLKNVFRGLFLTSGVILSTSGQGLVITAFIWIFFTIQLLVTAQLSRKKRILGLFIPGISLAAIPLLLKTEMVKNNLSRFLNSGTNTAVSARSEGYLAYFMETNPFYKIFGSGYGNTPEGFWFSGIAHFLYSTGLVGITLLIVFLGNQYIKSNLKLGRMLVIITIVLSASAEILNSYWIVFAFSLIIYSGHSRIKFESYR